MKWLKKLFSPGSTKAERQRAIGESTFDVMLNEGATLGEAIAKATDGANLVDSKQTWEHAADGKHDIDLMKRCCAAEIETFEKTGYSPAPFYFWRVAILSSKQKDYQQEVEYLEMYVDNLRRSYSRDDMSLEEAVQKRVLSARDCDIYDRLPKAKERVAKQAAAR